jgi:hypothetical protein
MPRELDHGATGRAVRVVVAVVQNARECARLIPTTRTIRAVAGRTRLSAPIDIVRKRELRPKGLLGLEFNDLSAEALDLLLHVPTILYEFQQLILELQELVGKVDIVGLLYQGDEV